MYDINHQPASIDATSRKTIYLPISGEQVIYRSKGLSSMQLQQLEMARRCSEYSLMRFLSRRIIYVVGRLTAT